MRVLAQQIESTINSGERQKAAQTPTYKAGQITIGIDERGPALIVAGTADLFKTVRELVKQLENLRPQARETKTMVIPIKNIPPADMKRILEQVINQNKGAQQVK